MVPFCENSSNVTGKYMLVKSTMRWGWGEGSISFGLLTITSTLIQYLMSAYPDYSHGIKRCLLLGRKVMTNLDSILKSRDITLPAKVCLVKAMVFSSSHVWM